MNDKQRTTLQMLEALRLSLSESVEKKASVVEILSNELQEEKEKLHAVEATIELIQTTESSVKADRIQPNAVDAGMALIKTEREPFPIDRIKGMSQPRAMVLIARHFDGLLRTRELADTLIEAGLMRRTKNSYSIASRLIRESERFEKITDGLYKLKAFDSQSSFIPLQ